MSWGRIYLRLGFGGLIFGRAYFWGDYYRNFMVFYLVVQFFCDNAQMSSEEKTEFI